MKKLTLTLITLTFCLFATAQTEAEAKAWMEYMTPGEVHKMLAKSVGDWKAEITHWGKPGSTPDKATGIQKNEMILGGRYLQTKHSGDMMGMPFEGLGFTGYDNSTKKFTSTWIDNMGTGIMVLEGTWNAQTNSLELKGNATDPTTGKLVPVREVLRIIDDKTQVMEMYAVADGKEFKTMEIKLTK